MIREWKPTSVDTHEVIRVDIKIEKFDNPSHGAAFQIIRIRAYHDDSTREGLDISLFMPARNLVVTKTGGPDDLIGRTIELKEIKRTPEEIGNSFDRGHGEGPGQ